MNYPKALASRSLTSSEISKLQHREETSQIRVTECSLLHCLTFFDKHSSTTGLVQQEPATTSSTPYRCGISARQVLLYVISSNQQNRCHHKQQKLSSELTEILKKGTSLNLSAFLFITFLPPFRWKKIQTVFDCQ